MYIYYNRIYPNMTKRIELTIIAIMTSEKSEAIR